MSSRLYHREHRLKQGKAVCFRLLCVFCVQLVLGAGAFSQPQTREPLPPDERIRYEIGLVLDFDNRTYSGVETVHWVNRGEHPTSTLFFHLYPNMRAPDYVSPILRNDSGLLISDEPVLEINEVRTAGNNAPV